MIVPIGTDVRPRRAPLGNYLLIAANVAVFLFTDAVGGEFGQRLKALYTLDASRPLLFQYVTYQFLHGDLWHLIGNMLFLWIFGNAVCDRLGTPGYLLFYLAGGIFAGVAYASGADSPIVGASGAIAAVTTAFLVLYPRVHVTLLLWILVIMTTIQVPAMALIIFKIILWDNIIAPRFGEGIASNVAYSAHLGGYAFGFAISLSLLLLRALPRNQFDLLALWNRWHRRTGLATQVTFGGPRPIDVMEMGSRPLATLPLTPGEQLREAVVGKLAEHSLEEATQLYQQLRQVDREQVLPRPQQLDIANHLTQTGRHAEAAAAYEAFLSAYPTSPDADQVRLLLGLIYSRYLRQYDRAIEQLRHALELLTLDSQRALALDELRAAERRKAEASLEG